LWPSPWPGAALDDRVAKGHPGLLRGLRDAVDVRAHRDHGFAGAPGGHPRGGDARHAALDLETVLLEKACQVLRRFDFLEAELTEAEHRVHHLLRELCHLVDTFGGVGLVGCQLGVGLAECGARTEHE